MYERRETVRLTASLALGLFLGAAGIGAGQTPSTTKAVTPEERRQLLSELADAERQVAQLRARLMTHELLGDGADARLLYERYAPMALVLSNRPRLGVTVDTRAEDGARLRSVLEDGPADEVGLRPGDLIVAVDGKSLVGGDGTPGERLIDTVREAEDGASFELTYLRDGQEHTARVVPRTLGPLQRGSRLRAPRSLPVAPQAPVFADLGLWGRWRDMQLVPMNEGLSVYFGVGEGLLVLEPPSDNEELQLEAGDVVLTVGDRTPSTATHLLRILRSYEEGETVRVTVMRRQRRQVLSFTVPEHSGRFGEPGSAVRWRPANLPRPPRPPRLGPVF